MHVRCSPKLRFARRPTILSISNGQGIRAGVALVANVWFHEAVNFYSENGVIRGYLPPRHLKAMRDGEPFTLVIITGKTAKQNANEIVGVQSDFRYVGKSARGGRCAALGLT